MGVYYCTREDVKSALDSKESARNNPQIDRLIESASRLIDGQTKRRFWPQVDTRFFQWPNDQMGRAWRLWLDENELISLSSLVSGGVTIPTGNVFLEPQGYGPPFNRIELDISTMSAFGGGSTYQRDIAITGLFGYTDDEIPSGALSADITNSATTIGVTNSAAVGVGSVLTVGTERMLVTSKRMVSAGDTLQTPIGALNSETSVIVADGTRFAEDEIILLGAERMLVVDIAANTLIVKRGWDGSVLAAHTGSTVFAARSLTVTRGALGTMAAAHLSGTAVGAWAPPGPVRQLCIALAVSGIRQESSAYAAAASSTQASRDATARGIPELWNTVLTTYGRNSRLGVV